MKRAFTALLCATLSLAGCVGGLDASGTNIQSHEHRAFAGSSIHSLRVENIAGPVVVTVSRGNDISIDATRRASSQDALDRTHVTYDRNGDSLTVKTAYDQGGSFFSHSGGGSVAYRIAVPASTDVDVANVSGAVTVNGTSGDVNANEVSGPIDVTAGRVSSGRRVHLSAVSGDITLRIARNSDAAVNAGSLSGHLAAFFPADEHKGAVGSSLKGRIGSGAGTITLSTISGSISIAPQ